MIKLISFLNIVVRNVIKYGDENYNNMEKQKSTLLEKYGQDCFMKTEEWKNKTIKTNKEKYGVEWALQNKEYRNKG